MDSFELRPLLPEDLPAVFAFHRAPEAVHMAAFTAADPDDRQAFTAHWERILADDSVVTRLVVADGAPAGTVVVFGPRGQREVGFWISPEHWGRGLATHALSTVLREVTERPLHARAAKDNAGSLRVLAKCGFTVRGQSSGYAHGRGAETEEYLLRLGPPGHDTPGGPDAPPGDG